MSTHKDISYEFEMAEVSRLVGIARERSEPDVCVGKRRWTRYDLNMRMEATTDQAKPGASWDVRMHNISGGGIGLWSKRDLAKGSQVFVRECSEGTFGTWLRGHVTYCTVGMRGYLIGVAFAHPMLPDSGIPLPYPAAQAVENDVSRQMRASPRPMSLRTQCALVSAACVAVAMLVPGLLGLPAWPDITSATYEWVQSIFLACVLAGLGCWLIIARQFRLLDALRSTVRMMARGETVTSRLPEARSLELGDIRQAILDLGSRWRSHEDDERAQRYKLEELNRIKSTILSTVSHDLRTPLTSILLYSRMLSEDLHSLAEEDQRHFLGIISDECTRLSRLVDDLLEVQRLEASRIQWNMSPQDLSGTVRACAQIFEPIATTNGIDFSVDCPASLTKIEADADRISQVLNNLLSNAMKYTPRGGSVRVSAEECHNEILFRTEDNGPGIPRTKWDQIFDRFTQLSSKNVREISGVGLGLYIVRQIVERHGGAVWVNSEVGEGATFCVSLPIVATHTKSRVEGAGSPPLHRVLVCDADPELAAIIGRILRNEGFEVRVVHSASRLLEQLNEAEMDVVVTDLLLPDIGATDLLESLQALDNRSFRLVVHSFEGKRHKWKELGVDVFLHRPASSEEMVLAVQTALCKRSVDKKIALLVHSGNTDFSSIERVLSENGHMTINTEDMTASALLAQDYPIDLLVVHSADLTLGWAKLKQLGIEGESHVRVVILCESVNKETRRLAAKHGVTVLPYQPGCEEQVLAEISVFQQDPVLETDQ